MTAVPKSSGASARHPSPLARAGRSRAVLVAAGAALVVSAYGLMLLDGDTLYPLINEDGWVENAGAVALAGAAALFLAAGIRAGGAWSPVARASLVGLAALFAVGAGEEASWGERFLGFDAPDALADANAQGESNLHNLDAVNSLTDHMFTGFVWIFAIALPLAAARRPGVRARARRLVPVLPAALGLLFLVNEIAFRVVWWAMPQGWYDGLHPFTQTAHEIRETTASVLFAVGALVTLRTIGAQRARDEYRAMPRGGMALHRGSDDRPPPGGPAGTTYGGHAPLEPTRPPAPEPVPERREPASQRALVERE
jgi:hypothetical protein